MGTVVVGLIVIIWVSYSVYHVIKSKQNGCGGSCSGCDTKSSCSSVHLYEAYRKDHPVQE